MAMEDLKAKKAMNYGGRRLQAGDTFQAPPSHANVLRLSGCADTYVAPVVQATKPRGRPRKNPPVASAGTYERRDMTPATESAVVIGAESNPSDDAQ